MVFDKDQRFLQDIGEIQTKRKPSSWEASCKHLSSSNLQVQRGETVLRFKRDYNTLGDFSLVFYGGKDKTGLNCHEWTRYCSAHLLGQLLSIKNSVARLRAEADLCRKLLPSAVTLRHGYPLAPHRKRVSST